MNDYIGITFIVLSVIGVFIGLKILAKPRKTTSDEFERNVADSGSLKNVSMNALNDMLNPEAARSTEIKRQMKQGTFGEKKTEGKSLGKAKIKRTKDDDVLNAEIIE